MSSKIFKAIWTVALLVFLASLLLIMGSLYAYFSSIQKNQLRVETELAAQGVSLSGAEYFEGLNDGSYRITWVSPEGGYAAVLHAGDMAGENMLVDIGNGTMNVMRIVDRKPIEKSVATEKYGVSICMREIRGELSRLYAEDVPESMIEPMLRSGCAGRHDQISEKIRSVATRYTEEIIRRLSIYGFREGLTKLYIIGGGGCLLKNYSDIGDKEGVVFIDDICANAKGFEYLAERKLELKGRR